MAFNFINFQDEDESSNNPGDIASAIKFGVGAILLQRRLDSIGNYFFPNKLETAKLSEERLRNRLLARQLGIGLDEADEMADGPPLSKQAMKALGVAAIMRALK